MILIKEKEYDMETVKKRVEMIELELKDILDDFNPFRTMSSKEESFILNPQ